MGFSFEKYILQSVELPWYSKSFHVSTTKNTLTINHLKNGARGYIIHAITLSTDDVGANVVKVNNEELFRVISVVGIAITHKIEHVVVAPSLQFNCSLAKVTMTIHYQYFCDTKIRKETVKK